MTGIKSILCPTDFSGPSLKAFQMACSVARDYGAKLILLHVRPKPIVASGVMTMEPEPPDERIEMKKKLDAIGPEADGLTVERFMMSGGEAEEILRLCREKNCDLIVMGTHGRTGMRRLLMGSVAEAVLRDAPCAVLTIRASAAER